MRIRAGEIVKDRVVHGLPRSPRSALLAACAAGALLLGVASTASAQEPAEPFAPWDGTNPFNCVVQDVGTGVDYPDPEADPLCVRFDKTQQNVTDLGLLIFLGYEPARTAAAGPKCFYHQQDHWTGSVIQGEEPELWNWEGNYFFDKAQGVGGISVRRYRIGGQPVSPDEYGDVPEPFKPYFGRGGGGFRFARGIPADPRCIALVDTPEERRKIYRQAGSEGESYGPNPRVDGCVPPRGKIRGREVAGVRLRTKRLGVRQRLGAPTSQRNGFDRYCLTGGGRLTIGYARARGSRVQRTSLLMTTSRKNRFRRVGPGTRRKRARRRLGRFRKRFRVGRTRVFEGPRRRGRRVFFGVRRGKVRYVALTDPRRIKGKRATRRALRRAG